MEFEIETLHSFVINKEKQADMEQNRHEEYLVPPRQEVSSDVNAKKDNLKKLLQNELVINDLGVEKKIIGMKI